MCDYLAFIDNALNQFSNNTKWATARFGKIKLISNTKVGDVGQVFFESVCAELRIPFLKPPSRESWDLEIHGIKFEIKTASEDVNGHFQFNHIRYHRLYDAVLLFGISPESAYFRIYSKADVATGKAGKMVTMEKGANASYKLTKSPDDLWLISELAEKLQSLGESADSCR